MNISEVEKVLLKLAEYENTGLEPEDILSSAELAQIACMQIKCEQMQTLLEKAVEELENCYDKETALTDEIRKVLS